MVQKCLPEQADVVLLAAVLAGALDLTRRSGTRDAAWLDTWGGADSGNADYRRVHAGGELLVGAAPMLR